MVDIVRRLAAFALVVLGPALLAGCGAEARGALVVGLEYTGGAWNGPGQLAAGQVVIFDARGDRADVLRVRAGHTATAQLPSGRYRLAVKQHGGCKPSTATVSGNRTTRYTLRLGCWPSTPKGVLASIEAAALAQKSVHVSESFAADLYGTDHRTFDVSRDSGSELLDYYGAKMRVLRVHHTVYVRADAWLLGGTMYTGGLDLTPKQVKRYAGKWISIPAGDKDYASLAAGLTLASVVGSGDPTDSFPYGHLSPDNPAGQLRLLRRQSHGVRRLVLRWTSGFQPPPPLDELRARATGTPLPVSFSDYTAMMVFYNGTYSRWNEPVHVRAPAHAIPISTIRG